MDRSTIEDRLQREIDVLVSDSKDVFSAVLGIAKAESDFHWSGAAGMAYAGKTQAMTKAHYSDTNYQLLGAVIESVAHKPFHEVLSELIVEPLELSSTYMHGYGESQATRDGPPAHVYYETRPLQLDRAMTSFLFYNDIDQLYIGGTLNQVQNQGRPIRLMLKIIKIVSEAVS